MKNNQIKQVEFLTSTGIPAKKLFAFFGLHRNSKVNVVLEFTNVENANLGMPLPKGKVRVMKADSAGSLQFVGEDLLDHTPQDEKVRLYLGDAFDIVGERTVVRETKLSVRAEERTIRIELRNRKDDPADVHVVEPVYLFANWKIVWSSHDFATVDAGTVEAVVTVPAHGKVEVEYTIRYNW